MSNAVREQLVRSDCLDCCLRYNEHNLVVVVHGMGWPVGRLSMTGRGGVGGVVLAGAHL